MFKLCSKLNLGSRLATSNTEKNYLTKPACLNSLIDNVLSTPGVWISPWTNVFMAFYQKTQLNFSLSKHN